MATRYNTVVNANVTTALGGTISAADTVIFQQDAVKYTAGGDLSAADLTAVTLTEGFRGTLSVADSGGLTLVVNQTSTGIVTNRSPSSRIDIRSTSASGVIYTVIQAGSGVMSLTYADTQYAVVTSGTLIVGTSADVHTYVVDGPNATLSLYEDASYPATLIEVNQGDAIIARDFTTLNVRGTGRATLASSTITATTATMHGGTLTLVNATTITNFNGYAGVLDLTKAERLPVFTTSVHHPGLTIRLRQNQAEPTWGSLTAPYGAAKRVYV